MSLVGEKEMRSVKLRLKLKRIRKVVFGWVEYQHESLRKEAGASTDVLASHPLASSLKSFKIRSCSFPELCKDGLYIRGYDRSCDNKPFAHAYESSIEAKEVCNIIGRLVRELNCGSHSEQETPQELPSMDMIE